jgi:hypothetical protein
LVTAKYLKSMYKRQRSIGYVLFVSMGEGMKEKPNKRIKKTSSFNEIATDQLGNKVGVIRGGVTPPAHPLI